MTALLALHIERALDPAETHVVRSMSRISINQMMLVLNNGKDIPVLKRALPVFEEILAKNSLYLVPAQSQAQDNTMADSHTSPQAQVNEASSQLDGYENNPSFDIDFLGFEFLDVWHTGEIDFTC